MKNKKNFTDSYKKEIVKFDTELGKKPVDVAKDIECYSFYY